jgi:hypothetical protein
MAEESSNGQMSGPEADVASIASISRLDRYLVELVGLTEGGLETVVGLLVAGNIVIGRMVSEAAIAKKVDEHVLSVLEMTAAASEDPESWDQLQRDMAGKHEAGFSERRDARHQMIVTHAAEYGDAQISPTEMPESLAREVLADHNRIAVTLAEANVFPPGVSRPLSVGVMRIDVRQVGGWWIIPTDPGTHSASFNYPGLA